MEGKEIRTTKRIANTSSQENEHKIMQMNDVDESFIHEQIKLEPIDIKDEQFEPNTEEIGADDGIVDSYDNEKDGSDRVAAQAPLKSNPKRIRTISNKCDICGVIFHSKRIFNDHFESHSNVLPYKCSRCSTDANPIIVSTTMSLSKHFETHSFKFVCSLCLLRFRTHRSLKCHLRDTHEGQKRGDVQNTTNHQEITECIQERIEQEPINIKIEPLNGDNDEKINDGETNHGNDNQNNRTSQPMRQRFKCSLCEKHFLTPQMLKRHKIFHKRQHPVSTRNTRRRMTTTEINESYSMEIKDKNEDETGEQIAMINNTQSSDVNNSDGQDVNNSINHNETDTFIQEQIELEPIDLKEEQLDPEDEETEEDETSHSYESENSKVGHPKKQDKLDLPEVVQLIPNKCFICDTIFKSKSELKAHLQSHNEMIPYECSRCSTETNPIVLVTSNLLNRHIETHGFNYACQQCPLRLRSNIRLRYHMLSVHNQERFEFDGKICKNIHSYKRYVRNYNNVTKQRFKCEFCGKDCSTRRDLHLHLEVHKKPQIAPKTNRSSCPKRIKYPHTDPHKVETIANKCYVCDTIYDSEGDFDKHLESHKTMLPFHCSQCSTEANPMIISALSNLNKHFERHGFYYVCPSCPLRYRTGNALISHKWVAHRNQEPEQKLGETATDESTDEPSWPARKKERWIDPKRVERIPNKCYICDTNHESKDDFDEHLKSHTNMLPFQCSRCSTEANPIKLGSLTTLNDHFERHSFHYVCPYCPLRFRTKDMIPKHKRITHENGQVETGNASADVHEQKIDETTRKRKNETGTEPSCIKKKKGRWLDVKRVKTIPNKCYICETIHENDNDLERHIDSHENMLPFKCLRCSTEEHPIEVFSVLMLNKHFERHGFYYVCPRCPLRYRTINALIQHKGSIHGIKKRSTGKQKSCEATKKEKTETEDDSSGVKKKRDPWVDARKVKTLPNKCYICETMHDDLEKHLDSHENMLPFKCLRCSTEAHPIEVCTVTALNKHFERHGFYYVCPHCPLRYRTNNTLLQHKGSIHGTKKRATGKQSLGETTMRRKNETEDDASCAKKVTTPRIDPRRVKTIINKCYICETTHDDLDKHLDSHENMLPFECPRCSTEAHPIEVYTLGLLNKHFERHGFYFVCPHCPLRYRTRNAMILHKTAVHGKKPRATGKQSSYNTSEISETESDTSKQSSKQTDHDKLEYPNSTGKSEPNVVEEVLSYTESMDDESNNDASNDRKRKEPLKKDSKAVETVPNKCYVCDTLLESKSDFDYHLEGHTSMLPYECSQCSTETNPMKAMTTVGLNKHFERHNFNYICPHCPLRYRTGKAMLAHVQLAHEDEKLQPDDCEQKSTKKIGKSLLSKEDSMGETTSDAVEQIGMINTQENHCNISTKMEIDEGFIQEQIQREPIDIKDDPFDDEKNGGFNR